MLRIFCKRHARLPMKLLASQGTGRDVYAIRGLRCCQLGKFFSHAEFEVAVESDERSRVIMKFSRADKVGTNSLASFMQF